MKLKKLCTHKMERDVTKLFACSMSEDNKLAIVTNDGVEIMVGFNLSIKIESEI